MSKINFKNKSKPAIINETKNGFGVFLGRICPVHLGHEKTIKAMVEKFGPENCMIVIGSSNAPITLRNFFNYEERRGFVKTIFPEVRVVGLPDYQDNKVWLTALDDLTSASGMDPKRVTFFGGCEEDVSFFIEDSRNYNIVNRFDGASPKISATEVRDALIHGRSLAGLLNTVIQNDVFKLFAAKWEFFKKI